MLEMLVGLAALTPADVLSVPLPIDLVQIERPVNPCGQSVPRLALPLRPMPPISSPFGPRWGRLHGGVDFPVPLGTPVYALADGVVARASANQSFGNVVVLRLTGGGPFAGDHVLYAHLHAIDVAVGRTIRVGDRLGTTGSTGRSTGPHLHLSHLVGLPEARVRRVGPMGFRERDHAVDPMPLLRCAADAAIQPPPFRPPRPLPRPVRLPGLPPAVHGADPELRHPAPDGSVGAGRPETRSQ